MALTAGQKIQIARKLARKLDGGAGFAFDKAELLAAIDTTETYIDSIAGAFNNSLPAAFKAAATTTQKEVLLVLTMLEVRGLT